jgi:hypothetical protein
MNHPLLLHGGRASEEKPVFAGELECVGPLQGRSSSVSAAGTCPTIAGVPRICSFYGIAIYMYWRDHAPPHFHARYGEHWAELVIQDGSLLKGALPPRAMRMVQEWRALHELELRQNWERIQRPEPPAQIDPLP